MKKVVNYLAFSVCFVLLITSASMAQGKADTAKVKNDKNLKAEEVKKKIDDMLADKNENAAKKMSKSLQSKGFKAENGYFGNESVIEKDGKTLTNTVYIQDYKKGNTIGAMGIVTVSDGTNKETYTFSLEKKGNNYTDVEEYYVNDKLEVQKANSWYSCLYKTLQAKCGSSYGLSLLSKCWTAYSTASWTSFISCIKSAWCGVTSFACCTCDCSWTCKWAVGCCDR